MLRRLLGRVLSSSGGHHLLPPQRLPHIRRFSSAPDSTAQIAQSVADQLSLPAEGQDLPLPDRLEAHFSHVPFDLPFLRSVLDIAPAAGRNVLGLHGWLAARPKGGITPDDTSISYFVEYLGRNHDFKAVHDLLAASRGVSGDLTYSAAVRRLARAGRPTQVVRMFEKMEKDYGFARNKERMAVAVAALCQSGSTGHAERFVKDLAHEFFPDEFICDALIRGWCEEGKLDEAKRLASEMNRGGFELGTSSCNAMLDCVCKLCRKKDPFRLQSEAESILLEMDTKGIPRDVGTFNVLIRNLCKIRRTTDALDLFDRMREWGCYPDATTYLLLIKSLYQAARIGEGDEMIDKMKSDGFGDALDFKAYCAFIKVLCGIERVEHAMRVFERMKKDGCKPELKTFELLIEKFATRGNSDRANALFRQAKKKNIPVEAKVYAVHPRFVKKSKTQLKKEAAKPKRETLPEKMARKRKRLKKLKLSFVKKPRKGRMRAY